MKKRICPECGSVATMEEETCHQCGYPLIAMPDKSKLKKWVIFGVSCCVLLAILIGAWWIPLQQSQKAYETAQAYETAFDYEGAIMYYSKVISRDDNYATACSKIKKLDTALATHKLIGKAFIAIYNENIATSLSALSDITTDGNTVSCTKDGIGYIISKDAIIADWDYFSSMTDLVTGLYIAKYEATYEYNGWLTVTTNQIRQETSDIMFEIARPKNTQGDIHNELIQNYIDLYNNDKDLSVFD